MDAEIKRPIRNPQAFNREARTLGRTGLKNGSGTNPHHEVHYPGIALTFHYITFYRKIKSDKSDRPDTFNKRFTHLWEQTINPARPRNAFR